MVVRLQVLPLGPAYEALIEAGDVILQVDGHAVTSATVFDALKGAPLSKVQLKVETPGGSVKDTVLERMPVKKGEVAEMKAVFDAIIQARSKISQMDTTGGLFDSRRALTASDLVPLLEHVFDAWSRSVLRHHARAMHKEHQAAQLLLDLEAALQDLQGCCNAALEQLAEARSAQTHASDKIRSLTADLSAAKGRLMSVEEELTQRRAELERVQERESNTAREKESLSVHLDSINKCLQAHADRCQNHLGMLAGAVEQSREQLQRQRASAAAECARMARALQEASGGVARAEREQALLAAGVESEQARLGRALAEAHEKAARAAKEHARREAVFERARLAFESECVRQVRGT